jgi:hypothetical protein
MDLFEIQGVGRFGRHAFSGRSQDPKFFQNAAGGLLLVARESRLILDFPGGDFKGRLIGRFP